MKIMTVRRILTICALFILVDAKWHNLHKREAYNICEQNYNTTNKVQCYCIKDGRDTNLIISADCYVTSEDVTPYDPSWDFNVLKKTHKLTLTNTRGFPLKYIPTNALKHTKDLLKIDVRYGNIEKIGSFAFSNLSYLEEISLVDSQIKILGVNAFVHHKELTTIKLDRNMIEEINRNVFKHLPALEKIFLTSNKITTIHDKAFVELLNLRELEINMNSLFSLNSETFAGLRKLQKLDLSSNSLEVIGDNTFIPLVNLRSLNLEGNNIQMLDEKAFNGLSKLQSLSLAHNKLSSIDNVKTFEGLENLNSLSLRANGIMVLKSDVMAPILNNFYSASSSLDVEDNNFPCDCHLDWFISLMNRTQSSNLKLSLENLKCYPDFKIRELWTKLDETDKNTGGVFEDENGSVQNSDYEYYDESQLNGRLFYVDVRYLLNCSNTAPRTPTVIKEMTTPVVNYDKKTDERTKKVTTEGSTHKLTTSTAVPSTTHKNIALTSTQPNQKSNVANHGLLDLSVYETTAKYEETAKNISKVDVNQEKKDDFYTTSRLATVSAKPIETNHNMYVDGMASDEAKPDKLKAHRSIQDKYNDDSKISKFDGSHSGARQSLGCVTLIITILSFKIF